MKAHTSSGAIVYRKTNSDDNEILLLYRRETDSWHLPKGTQEAGETLEETAQREILEETGVEIVIESYVGYLPSTFERNGETVLKTTHYFLATPQKINLNKHDHEHDFITFLTLDDAITKLNKRTVYESEGKILKQVRW